jgi:hypothetical protein
MSKSEKNLIRCHPERSREWSGWGGRDIDGQAGGGGSGRRPNQISLNHGPLRPRDSSTPEAFGAQNDVLPKQ